MSCDRGGLRNTTSELNDLVRRITKKEPELRPISSRNSSRQYSHSGKSKVYHQPSKFKSVSSANKNIKNVLSRLVSLQNKMKEKRHNEGESSSENSDSLISDEDSNEKVHDHKRAEIMLALEKDPLNIANLISEHNCDDDQSVSDDSSKKKPHKNNSDKLNKNLVNQKFKINF